MLQISNRGLAPYDPATISGHRDEFYKKRSVIMPGLLEPSLAADIVSKLTVADFYPNAHVDDDHHKFAADLTIGGGHIVLHQIHMLLNNPDLFQVIREITGCPPVGSFTGRIYRNLPCTSQALDWHDDAGDRSRLVGISVNLSKDKYLGGCFQIRQRSGREILREVGCLEPGDAHIFQISNELEHRVKPTNGVSPRTSAAGWFVSGPPIGDVLKSLITK